jgi:hypothetical protein
MRILGKCEHKECGKIRHVKPYITLFTIGVEWLCNECVELGGVIKEVSIYSPVTLITVKPRNINIFSEPV